MTVREFFKNSFSFSDEEIEMALRSFEERTFLKNEFFLKEGQVCRHVACIEKGTVVYWQNVDGEERTLDFAFEGDWITQYQSLNNQAPSLINIQMLEDTKVAALSADNMQTLFAKLPSMYAVRTSLAENYFVKQAEHASNLSNLSAEERYAKLMRQRPEVFRRLPLSNIASYLGITQRHLSRIRSMS